MNGPPLIHAIQERLLGVGFRNLSTPVKLAGVEFEFTGMMLGSKGRSLDLVLLVDTTTGDFADSDGARIRQRIQAFNRALDITGSRYVVTAILAGASLKERIEQLSDTCRMLQVESLPVDDRIRSLLPLDLPPSVRQSVDGSGSAMEQFTDALPIGINQVLVDAVIAASSSGERAVADAAVWVIGNPFLPEQGDEQS